MRTASIYKGCTVARGFFAEVLRGPAPVDVGSQSSLVAGLACPVQRSRRVLGRSLATLSRSAGRHDHAGALAQVFKATRRAELVITPPRSLLETVTKGSA